MYVNKLMLVYILPFIAQEQENILAHLASGTYKTFLIVSSNFLVSDVLQTVCVKAKFED